MIWFVVPILTFVSCVTVCVICIMSLKARLVLLEKSADLFQNYCFRL